MIRLEGLAVEFAERGVRALDGVDLRIDAGEHVALLGPSGAGKTTLLRAVLGAVPAAAGTARVGGIDPWGPPSGVRALRRRTGMIRQGDDLVLGLRARLNIATGTAGRWRLADWLDVARGRTPRRFATRLAALAEQHGISECLTARADLLSGGQRQRVALCRALLPAPTLLLADEPTGQLDPAAAAGVVRALRDVEGVTVVVATHDLTVARAFPRMVALRDGKIVHDGTGFDRTAAATVYGVEA